jgi:hypothetical protein
MMIENEQEINAEAEEAEGSTQKATATAQASEGDKATPLERKREGILQGILQGEVQPLQL